MHAVQCAPCVSFRPHPCIPGLAPPSMQLGGLDRGGLPGPRVGCAQQRAPHAHRLAPPQGGQPAHVIVLCAGWCCCGLPCGCMWLQRNSPTVRPVAPPATPSIKHPCCSSEPRFTGPSPSFHRPPTPMQAAKAGQEPPAGAAILWHACHHSSVGEGSVAPSGSKSSGQGFAAAPPSQQHMAAGGAMSPSPRIEALHPAHIADSPPAGLPGAYASV